ncbi:MAG: ATP-binding protein [Deltaproteobacteria bacterium]|nr:ATP-binding protein [Deltaproteobacteria bacterium]
MLEHFKDFRQSLSYRLIFMMGLTLFISFSTWAYFSIKYQKDKAVKDIVVWTDRLSETIKLGTHYAMMLNARDYINESIQNMGRQKTIEHIRIFNKEGEIKFSNSSNEVGEKTNIKAEACFICHKTEPPRVDLDLSERIRINYDSNGYRQIGVITPIRNETSCATDACHVHPQDKMILGALDVVVSMKETDDEIVFFEEGIISLASFIFTVTSAVIFIFIVRFIKLPIQKLIDGTRLIAKGQYQARIDIRSKDELGQLAAAFQKMGNKIGEKRSELRKQRNEYRILFEQAPCIISVQNRDYRLVRYNREFSERFDPKPGDYCFSAYKGRIDKCKICPVEKTFEDGLSHYSEEAGVDKDGTRTYWIVRTSPIRDDDGNIVAAMEMCIDISQRKQLEEKLAESEKQYYAVFNNIPNPVFVLDMNTLEILDCNQSVKSVYGYVKNEIMSKSFLELFSEEEREYYAFKIQTSSVFNRVKHVHKSGKTLFVNIRISFSKYRGKKVLLLTTGDDTKRLEAEQQIIQASKMATLGEMATGVAHELNQPLSVIKTASSFFMKKINRKEPIKEEILYTLSQEIDSHVDRATRIINHMRLFGRKSEMTLEKVQVNDILKSAFEIFSQQLKVRGIVVAWDLYQDIPLILADPGRLEQVFINLLLNARDAIEEKCDSLQFVKDMRQITLKTTADDKHVTITVSDTGIGIPQDKLNKIFEPFFTTKKVGKGTGLGLSISYSFIKECQGDIRAVNNEDGGSTFILSFPIAPDP